MIDNSGKIEICVFETNRRKEAWAIRPIARALTAEFYRSKKAKLTGSEFNRYTSVFANPNLLFYYDI